MAKKTRQEWMQDLQESQNTGDFERASKIRQALQLEPVDYAALQQAQQAGDLATANELRKAAGMQVISDQGAPAGVRAATGASRGPGAVQQSLEGFYPGQVQPFGPDNFMVPGANGRPTLYNPPGLDWGDVAAFGRPLAEAGGALTGGFLGLPGNLPGVMLGAGLGGETAGMAYDAAMQNWFGAADTRGQEERLRDTAFGVSANAVGGPALSRPVGIAADSAELAMRAGPAVEAQMVENASSEIGLPPLTPAQRGNRFAERVEGALEGSLFGSPPIVQQRQAIGDAFNRYIDETWPSPISRQEAGAGVVQGVEQSAAQRRGTVAELYDRLDQVIDTEGRIDVPQSREWLAEIDARIARDPEYAQLVNRDPQLQRYMKVLRQATKEVPPTIERRRVPDNLLLTGGRTEEVVVDPGRVAALPPYDTVKQFRSSVGAALDSPFSAAQPGTSMPEKRRLYATLSDDMEAGAVQLGGEEARQAASRANWYNRGLMRRLEKIDPVFRQAENPTRVYELLSSRVMSDPTTVAAVKKTLPPEAWEDFVNRYVRDLLAATPGAENAMGDAVSFGTIATNLNRLKRKSPEGFALIAGGKEQALNHLHVLANRLRENARFFNTSRTGNVNSLGSVGLAGGGGGLSYLLSGNPQTALAAAGVGLASSTVLPWLTAKTLTSPTMQGAVQKLARSRDLSSISTTRQLAAALVAAGADEQEVLELIEMDGGLE